MPPARSCVGGGGTRGRGDGRGGHEGCTGARREGAGRPAAASRCSCPARWPACLDSHPPGPASPPASGQGRWTPPASCGPPAGRGRSTGGRMLGACWAHAGRMLGACFASPSQGQMPPRLRAAVRAPATGATAGYVARQRARQRIATGIASAQAGWHSTREVGKRRRCWGRRPPAHPPTHLRKPHRQAGGQAGLAHPALARHHDVFALGAGRQLLKRGRCGGLDCGGDRCGTAQLRSAAAGNAAAATSGQCFFAAASALRAVKAWVPAQVCRMQRSAPAAAAYTSGRRRPLAAAVAVPPVGAPFRAPCPLACAIRKGNGLLLRLAGANRGKQESFRRASPHLPNATAR